jgi:hypothetical protein
MLIHKQMENGKLVPKFGRGKIVRIIFFLFYFPGAAVLIPGRKMKTILAAMQTTPS